MATNQVEQDALAIARLGFDAFDGRHGSAVGALRKDANWRATPTGVLGGDCIGRDAIFAMFQQLGRETGGEFHVAPNTFAAAGNQAFVSATDHGKRHGRRSCLEDGSRSGGGERGRREPEP